MIRYPCYQHPSSSDQYVDALASGLPAPEYRDVCDGDPERTRVRVGVSPRARWRLPGPTGTTAWRPIQAGGRQQFIQEYDAEVYPLAMIEVGSQAPVTLTVHNATQSELELLNATFCSHALVPMAHLRRMQQVRPAGIYVGDYRGRAGRSERYTGGVNLSDRIVLTRGSLWATRDIGINATILHELGHVLTHNHPRYCLDVSRDVARTLEGTSENEGDFEGVCNQYMYLLCYGARNAAIHRWGCLGSVAGRRIVRATRAIRNLSADEICPNWQHRLRER